MSGDSFYFSEHLFAKSTTPLIAKEDIDMLEMICDLIVILFETFVSGMIIVIFYGWAHKGEFETEFMQRIYNAMFVYEED